MESGEIDITAENTSGSLEESPFTRAMRHVVLIIDNILQC